MEKAKSYAKERSTKFFGRKFGRLTVVGRTTGDCGQTLWRCRCDCGKTIERQGGPLLSGNTRSCGCLRSDLLTSHGVLAKGAKPTATYKVWKGMKGRCYTRTSSGYAGYGGRGITVCERWRNSYENFLADMGERPSLAHSIDRINGNGNYEPSNCRWADAATQNANRKLRSWNAKHYLVGGVSRTIKELKLFYPHLTLDGIRRRLVTGAPLDQEKQTWKNHGASR